MTLQQIFETYKPACDAVPELHMPAWSALGPARIRDLCLAACIRWLHEWADGAEGRSIDICRQDGETEIVTEIMLYGKPVDDARVSDPTLDAAVVAAVVAAAKETADA